ncbi:unnamed protein product [Alopecurus aequalis]
MGDAAVAILNRGSSILLARKPRVTDSRNGTTATAESQDGYTMAVSFWVAHPPQLSLFSIHATDKHAKRRYFSDLPRVVGADGPFVLLRATFDGSVTREYFLYKAAVGAAAAPSLERIPSPSPEDDICGRGVREFGVLGVHRGGGSYLLAALRDAPSSDDDDGYQLRIYSSETKSWSTRTMQNPCPGVDRVVPDKVITLGGQDQGSLGWVDLSHGILVCNLLLLLQHQDDHDPPAGAVTFIPLPEPLPGNRYKLKYPIPPTKKVRKHPMADEPYCSASWFRDLTCVDGVLKFVEMENTTPPESEDNIIYNSDLIVSLKRKAVDGNSKLQLSAFRDAWRAVTWTQKLASPASASNFWRQTCAAHVVDIKQGQQLALTELYSAFPILSTEEDGDDILYLKSLPEPGDRDGSVVAVDIGNKSLKATALYYLPDDFYYNHPYDPEHPFLASTLSRHLDMTNPGIQVSACRKITEASSSSPSETSIKPRTTIERQVSYYLWKLSSAM